MIARLHTPRNRELVNLLLVGLLVVTGFRRGVHRPRERGLDAPLSYAALFIGLYGVAHVVLRFALPRADPYLLPLVALLAAIGEVEIYRINPVLARDQGLWIIVGLLVFSVIVFAFRDIRKLEGLRYTCGAAAVLLLAATVVVGTEVNGAKLWIQFGGYQIQPGEFAKVLLVVFIAATCGENREVLERPARRVMGVGLPALRHLLPLLAMWGIALVLLVVVNDFGSCSSTTRSCSRCCTSRPAWLYVGGGIVAFAVGPSPPSAPPHVQDRIDIWIDPWATSRTSEATRSCSPSTRSPTAASSAPASAAASSWSASAPSSPMPRPTSSSR